VGLLMTSFALGALAGRGDIYRLAYSWGVLTPDGTKVAQWVPAPGPPAAGPGEAPGTATTATVASAVPAPAPAAKPERPGPVAGSIVPPAQPAAAKKKGKTGTSPHDPKSREEELRKVRQEVAQKLKFQNSFDTGPKPRVSKAKESDKAHAAQVRVAQFKTSKEAEAKIAELQKKGVKATLKKTKDAQGTVYTVYKTATPAQPGGEKLVQKPEKSSGAAPKPKTE
jgi:hypothetical protein